MLQIIGYENPRDLRPLFQRIDPFGETLLISHLRTKLEIQDILLKEKTFVVDESLLRISEFSELMFKRLFPAYKVIQRDLAEIKIKNFLKAREKELGIDPELAPSLLEFIEFLGNFLAFKGPRQQIQDWFNEGSSSRQRWKQWYLVGGLLCDLFLSEGKVLRPWLPAFLSEKISEPVENFTAWSRKIFVDLRTDITWSEAELFLKLSKYVDVVILVPDYGVLSEKSRPVKIYEYLEGFADQKSKSRIAAQSDGKVKTETLKVSGSLAEVRACVSVVRTWLNGGVSPASIAVVAPNVEDYWPMFEAYFKTEGIPVKKKSTFRYSAIPAIQKWMAKHQLVGKSLSSSHLESLLFNLQDNSNLKFSEFEKLYSRIYDHDHLGRHGQVHATVMALPQIDSADQPLGRDEFVSLSLSLWDFNEETDFLVDVLKNYVAQMEVNDTLSFKDHLFLLEKLISRREETLRDEEDGIVFTAIASGHILDLTHKVYIGLLQENFKNRIPPFVSVKDLQDLQNDLGFHIENPEEEKASIELTLQKSEDQFLQNTLWICPATHLSGEVGTPHPLWIAMNQSSSVAEVNGNTVWESWQGAWDADAVREKMSNSLKINSPREISLSPSSVRDLLTCPFIYRARKNYYLEDPDWVDVETPASEWGKVQHDLAEKILSKDLETWDIEGIRLLVDEIMDAHPYLVSDKALLKPLKEKLFRLADRFLEVEKKWRAENKSLARQEFEKPWERKVTFKDHEFTFQGFMDRVDHFPEGAVIFDYKSSRGSLKNHGSWLKDDELQLLFYQWGLEEPVLGTLYYVLKDLLRDKGLLLESSPVKPEEVAKKALISEGDFQELKIKFTEKIEEVMNQVISGDFSAKPKDRKTCIECSWRKTCRATHLAKI